MLHANRRANIIKHAMRDHVETDMLNAMKMMTIALVSVALPAGFVFAAGTDHGPGQSASVHFRYPGEKVILAGTHTGTGSCPGKDDSPNQTKTCRIGGTYWCCKEDEECDYDNFNNDGCKGKDN